MVKNIQNIGKAWMYLWEIIVIIFCSQFTFAKSFVLEHKANCFTITNKNNIFIGTSQGLCQYKEREITILPQLGTKNVKSLFSINELLFVGTLQGELYLVNGNKIELLAKLANEISCIQVVDSKIIVGTKGSGLCILEKNSKKYLSSSNSNVDDYINSIALFEGKLLIATDNGLCIVNPKNNFTNPVLIGTNVSDPLITAIYVKNSNEFLFGTSLGYVYSYKQKENQILHQGKLSGSINLINDTELCTSYGLFTREKINLLDNGNYLAALTDSEKNTWYLKENELIFKPYYPGIFTIKDFNHVKNVHSIFSYKNNLFFTPDIGLIILKTDQTFKYVQLSNQNNHIDITSFFVQNDSTIWIGTMGDGIFKFNTTENSFKQIILNADISTAGILSISGNEKELFVSTLNGAWHASTLPNKIFQFSSIEDRHSIKRSYVYQIKMDSHQRVWLATEGKGLLLLENGKLNVYNPNGVIKAKSFYSIYEDIYGNLFFGSDKEGLYVLKNSKIYNLNDKSGLYHNHILGITSYKNYVMIAHDSSYTILNSTNLRSSFYNYPSGYQTELNSLTNWNNNYLVGCDNGILSIPFINQNPNNYPQPLLSAIKCNNKIVDKNQVVFSHENNNFMFHLGYSFSHPHLPLYFRYKLEGYNEDWVETKDKIILFNLLNNGLYKLLYQVSNNPTFQFAHEIQYSFEIKKPFWKTIWFWMLSVISVILLIRIILKYRIKQASKLKEIEQQKQLAEFDALKSQVNPHFLFNSFNSLIQIIEEDKEQAIEYTTLLSDLYRNILTAKDQDLILLEDELRTVKDFIKLHQVNLGAYLELKISYFKTKQYHLCPLTLQLLAENAIKHNSINKNNPLRIDITIDNEFVIVRNNINKKITPISSEKIGLQNIQKRYQKITPRNVIIEQTENYFIVKIPLIIK